MNCLKILDFTQYLALGLCTLVKIAIFISVNAIKWSTILSACFEIILTRDPLSQNLQERVDSVMMFSLCKWAPAYSISKYVLTYNYRQT